MKPERVKELAIIANRVRKNVLTGVYNAACGHPGGSLSITDVLTVLYFEEMNVDPTNPKDPKRDRFVLSKGHCAPALYGVLAERGYFDPAELVNLRKFGHFLQGHPEMKGVPGVDMSTGSLGQGVAAACGMAKAAKIDGVDYRVYAALGDGEIEEGQVWESAMFAAHHQLDNLTIFIDNNNLQIDGDIRTVMNPHPIDEKYKAFGFHVICIDGHDYAAIADAIAEAKTVKGKPTAVICSTVKGKGVSYMENNYGWHGKAPNEDEYKQAMADLEAIDKELGVL